MQDLLVLPQSSVGGCRVTRFFFTMAAGKRSYNDGMGKLLLLFVIVPAAELALLIQAGIYLGTWPTLALIVFTGIVGAYLARRQGLSVLTRAQKQMARGDVPAGSLADGVLCQNSALLK